MRCNARGVADGSVVKVVSLYTGARGMDNERSNFLLPLAGSRVRFTAVDKHAGQDRNSFTHQQQIFSRASTSRTVVWEIYVLNSHRVSVSQYNEG